MVQTKYEKDAREIRAKFRAFYSIFRDDILEDPYLKSLPFITTWMQTLCDKTVPNGKQNRGLLLVSFYQKLVADQPYSEEDMRLAYLAGWFCEAGQAAALIADDMMDSSETRRGQKCWYKEPNVGLTAINDCFLMENMGYYLIWKNFAHKDYCIRLIRQFQDMTLKTIFGQCMDTRSAMEFSFKNCTMDIYRNIVLYKTTYYTFYSPIEEAMIMANVQDEKLFDAVKTVAFPLGHLFQVQDDYLDCFGDPKITGKVGTDIIDKKCTWLLVKALEFANDTQRDILEENYGKADIGCEEAVKEIYKEIGIKRMFWTFEDEEYDRITKLIKELPNALPQEPFLALLNLLYKRDH